MKRCVVVVLIPVTMMVLSGYAVLEAGSADPIVPKEKIALWNGKDFSGWKLFVENAEHDVTKTWSVKDGVIRCEGQPAGYMRTEADYADYLFHMEWRWPEGSGNSGVLVHMSGPDIVWPKCIECQLYAGHAGDFLVIGEGPRYLKGVNIEQRAKGGPRVKNRKVAKLKESSEKPVGEWNVYEIICKDDWVVVFVNGVLQNVATKATITSGKICLQSEGRPIEFRNIYIEPVE
ncbi:MAG: 3-keto-disaccharide hydrolase [Planctomycetota bacterium]